MIHGLELCRTGILEGCAYFVRCVRLARTIYIRCIYGNFGREITEYTVMYGVYVRFWPNQLMCDMCVCNACVFVCTRGCIRVFSL
jgi:hypothetical protein